MAFDYTASQVAPGRTIPVEMEMLPKRQNGKRPVAHVQLLDDNNPEWIGWVMDHADPNRVQKPDRAERKRKRTREELIADRQREAQEEMGYRRSAIRFAVKRLEAEHSDGTPATETDIPDWCKAIPDDAVTRLWIAARSPDMHRNETADALESARASEVEIAEK